MRPHRGESGFTLIELLVTLIILGLTASLVGPAVFSWLDSREAAARRNTLENSLSMLPLETLRSGKAVTLEQPGELGMENTQGIRIEEPIIVLANGYCKSGRVSLTLQQRVYYYQINAPFCEVELIENN
ncbi:pilus assembly FimT family protein [Alteromonas halophila]|nr:prepilin-type N-terminal cleavage/methylation domain-containing protein [Alteromonas halophila]